jgi:hypothetical protein
MGAAHERQAGADVEKLPHSRLGHQEAQYALLERAHGRREAGYYRCGRGQLVRGLAIGLEMIVTAVHV